MLRPAWQTNVNRANLLQRNNIDPLPLKKPGPLLILPARCSFPTHNKPPLALQPRTTPEDTIVPQYDTYFATVDINQTVWRPCCYLPNMDSAIQLQEQFYNYRMKNKKEELQKELLERKKILGLECYQRFLQGNAESPVWFVLGGHPTLIQDQVATFIAVQDSAWLPKFQELSQACKTDPDLQAAMLEFLEYRKFVNAHPKTTTSLVPPPPPTAAEPDGKPVATTTTASTNKDEDHNDSSTVVTMSSAASVAEENTCHQHNSELAAASGSQEEELGGFAPPARKPTSIPKEKKTSSGGKRGNSRNNAAQEDVPATHSKKQQPTTGSTGRSRKRERSTPTDLPTRSSKRSTAASVASTNSKDSGHDKATPLTGHRQQQPPSRQSSKRKQAPLPADTPQRYPQGNSGRVSSGLFNRKAWVNVNRGPSGQVDDDDDEDIPDQYEGDLSPMATKRQVFPASEEPQQRLSRKKASHLAEEDFNDESPVDTIEAPMEEDDEPAQAENDTVTEVAALPLVPQLVADPIPQVTLPGVTVREKLHGCLNALRKENESVVGCPKILAPRQTIQDFFQALIESKGQRGFKDNSAPILHVCGAPGSGKSMTVEQCCQLAKEKYAETCEEWELPPKFCYVNCSTLQNLSEKEALRVTLEHASTNEKNLKRRVDTASNKCTVVFILDEIDYLVSTGTAATQRTSTEAFIHTLVQWASKPEYMVGLVGISNSVENEKVERLSCLGFPRSNKVVFRTYDEKDLKHIALSKIGNSVVDEKAIEFLSKKVAQSSGDARKFLEVLSRCVMDLLDSMSEEALNAPLDKPVVKVPHILKADRASTIKYRDLIQDAPAHEKHVLCICVHVAEIIGSRPISFKTLLSICNEAYLELAEIDTVSEIRSIAERLKDSGLLQFNISKGVDSQKIQFAGQLEDVVSAVEEVLMKQNFYRSMVERLKAMKIVGWAF